MALIDLRDRLDEPEIAALITLDAGAASSVTEARQRLADLSWIPVGWTVDAHVVGYAGVERVSEVEIAVRALTVSETFRRRGHGRALLDALASVVTAERISAEATESTVGFFRRSGFTTSDAASASPGRFDCVRIVRVEAASAASVEAMTLSHLEEAIRIAWSRDTSDDADEWTEQNPARGQCGVTALLVRELLGGEILVAGVVRDGRRVERHAWNRLPSGLVVDLTRDQFRNGELLEPPIVDEPISNRGSRERFGTLRERVYATLALEPAVAAA